MDYYIIVLLLGVFYGFFVGLVPVAGATTGLVALFSFLYLFPMLVGQKNNVPNFFE